MALLDHRVVVLLLRGPQRSLQWWEGLGGG
jgi:hypothetical protein